RCAEGGDPTRYHLPTPKVDTVDPGLQDLRAQILELRGADSKIQDPRSKISLHFSFSGLKTAVLRAVQKECGVRHDFPSFQLAERLSETQKADFAASFQAKAVDYLVSKTT